MSEGATGRDIRVTVERGVENVDEHASAPQCVELCNRNGVAPAETSWPPGTIRIAYAPEQRREIWPLVLSTTPSVQADARAGLGNQEQQ